MNKTSKFDMREVGINRLAPRAYYFPYSSAEKAIEALQEIAAATSKVIRDGHQITVKSEDLVVGDIIVLEAGGDPLENLQAMNAAIAKM